MEYRELGSTGMLVSEIGMGCEGFSEDDCRNAMRLFDAAEELGINYFDLYTSDPKVRASVGQALQGRREKFYIQSHLCSVWKNGQYMRTRKIDEVKAGMEEMLSLLQTDSIDVGMIHYCDELEDFHAIFDTGFIELATKWKQAGRIGSIGLSSHNPVVAKMAVETGLIDVLMFSVNPCYDVQPPGEEVEKLWADEVYEAHFHNFNPEREELYALCERRNVGIDVMKVFAGGDLLKADQSMFGRAMTPVQALNYALTRPAVAAVMAGCVSVAEIEAALRWCTASEEERDYSTVLAGLERCSWSGHCMYCGHCAPCPKEIRIADVNKFLNLALARGGVPETVREHYRALAHHASECIQCGACEKRCPFSVPVREKMKQAAELFGC